MSKRTVILRGMVQREYAKQLVDLADDGEMVTISKPTRSNVQNAKLHALAADLQTQVPGFDTFSIDDIKLRLMNAFGTELRFLPTLEGEGLFPVGQRTSTLTVQQFSGLLELIYEFGSRHGVKWSENYEGRYEL